MTDQMALMRSAIPHQAECPGECNRNHRARPGSFEPVMGEPVWCESCSRDIADAIGSLPDVAAALWAIGHDEAGSVWQEVVDRDVDTRGPDPVVIHVREWLKCGHRVPTVTVSSWDRAPDVARIRPCWQCAIDLPGVDGRLAPVSAAARRGPRLLGSPAGSPSYLAVDEVVSWAVSTADYLKARLPGDYSATPTARTSSEDQRSMALTECSRFLVEWVPHLLATPHARAIGREAIDLERRARRSAGLDSQPDEQLPGQPCPGCDLVALKRRGRDPEQIVCTSCRRRTTDRELEQLATPRRREARR